MSRTALPTRLAAGLAGGNAQDRLRIAGPVALARGRAHEICGAARRTLALAVARALAGPVYWIQPAWHPDRLNGAAVTEWIDPGRLIFVHPRRAEDVLWAMEEVLRSGVVPLVVADLPQVPGLTAIRRLHLAAETGSGRGAAPVGIVLTPGEGGAPGIETRWSFAPDHGPERRTAWRLALLRARAEPPGCWSITRDRDEAFSAVPPGPAERR